MDTSFSESANRFTTVDAFIFLDNPLPAEYLEVNNNFNDNYPASVFTDAAKLTYLNLRDSFTFTVGFDNAASGCAETLPEYIYLGVRCGNPDTAEGSWDDMAEPCAFRLRYVVVPQHLTDGDIIGPLPVAQADVHTYSVAVGTVLLRIEPTPSTHPSNSELYVSLRW